MDWNDKSNNQILTEIKEMQQLHEATKAKIIVEFDRLEHIEKSFKEANDVIKERLKGNG